MREYLDMATYDQWSYVTMPGTLFSALREAIQIDRRLLVKTRNRGGDLQENRPLTACLQMASPDLLSGFDIMAQLTKQIGPGYLWLVDT